MKRKELFKIYIENLTIDAVIGILDFEREKEQKVIIDMEIEYEFSKNYLDYKEISDCVSQRIVEKKFFLIEEALQDLTKTLKEKFSPISFLKVKITKPNILKNCVVGVEIQKKY